MEANEVWRVGLRVPVNVYEGDRPVCQCHTEDDARRIVAAMSAQLAGQGECLSWKALMIIKAWFEKLESASAEDDPLTALRREFHAPVHAAIELGLQHACHGDGARKEERDAPGV